MCRKLTVLIPCKDERRNIRPCIASVARIADEILIADSGSTDGTLEIVPHIGGCRIIEREYINSANFKNWAIPQAENEWVLVVDADEQRDPELAQEIQQFLESPPADKDAFWIGRINHYLGYHVKHCGWNSDDVIRLFRREVGRYETRWVHAEIDVPSARLGSLKSPFLHYTTWDSDQYLRKQIRYAQWARCNCATNPAALRLGDGHPAAAAVLQLYLFRLGFLDGIPGLQVCMTTAFYAFLKQAKLWELHYAIPQPDPEADDAKLILTLPENREASQPATQEQPRRRHAA